MSNANEFDLLHTLRMKGVGSAELLSSILRTPLDDVRAGLAQFVADGGVREVKTPRGPAFSLTEAGASRHAVALSELRTPQSTAALEPVYEQFLMVNGEVKRLCAAWQAAAGDEAARWEAIDGVVELHDKASVILVQAGAVEPRFSRYGERLASALARLQEGDDRFFTGLLVDSFHNVWFECHEDFIQTLGRHRLQEGSF